MKHALERHDGGATRVIPVIVRSVYWLDAPFAKLQVLPTGGQAVDSWTNRDAAWEDVCRGIRRVLAQTGVVEAREDGRYELVAESLPGAPRTFLRVGDQLMVGRSAEADVRLADTMASRLHCRLYVDADGVRVSDCSRNGTFVNDERVREATLHPGDGLRCGRSVFRLIDPQTTAEPECGA